MAPVIRGLRAMTLHATDIQKSRGFYSKVLGLKEEGPTPTIPRVVFKIPGVASRLSMHVTDSQEGGCEPGTVSGIQFDCADPEAASTAIKRRGGTVVDEPWTMVRGQAKISRAVIADPDGNEFILSSAL